MVRQLARKMYIPEQLLVRSAPLSVADMQTKQILDAILLALRTPNAPC